jgi:serine/threonine protein kinase
MDLSAYTDLFTDYCTLVINRFNPDLFGIRTFQIQTDAEKILDEYPISDFPTLFNFLTTIITQLQVLYPDKKLDESWLLGDELYLLLKNIKYAVFASSYFEKFNVIKSLGKGVNAEVYLCLDTITNSLVAVRPVEYYVNVDFLEEIRSINSQYIPKILDVAKFQIKLLDGCVECITCLVTEYKEGFVDMCKKIDTYEDLLMKLESVSINIVLGFKELHNHYIIHGDVRVDNILVNISTGEILIIDYDESESFCCECDEFTLKMEKENKKIMDVIKTFIDPNEIGMIKRLESLLK